MRSAAVFGAVSALVVGAFGQAVKLPKNHASADAYADAYRTGQPIHFEGKVTGMQTVQSPRGGDWNVSLLVKNNDGGGQTTVELGPDWFVNAQEAKLHMKDRVEVNGRKLVVDGRGFIVPEMIVVNRPTGKVLTLRSPNGHAYWMGPDYAARAMHAQGSSSFEGTVKDVTTFAFDHMSYSAAVVQTNNGFMTVDLGPTSWYDKQNFNFRVGDHVSVVAGTNPIAAGPYSNILPAYVIYRGQSEFKLRNESGSPVFN